MTLAASAPLLAPLLEIRNLNLRIGPRSLIHDFSATIEAGQLWCILGANGVGKTLLLHTLVGLRRIDGGTIALCGKPIVEWKGADAARVRGFLPQAIHDPFRTSALNAVLMGRHPYLSRWQWEGEAERGVALAALAAVGLAGFEARDVTTLSGGERQRVAIAALLAQDVPLMLLDEPITHLDLSHQLRVLRHLQSIVRDDACAALFSIHDLNLAWRFATHAMLFGDDASVTSGRIDEVMSAEALSAAFGYPVKKITIGARTIFVAD